MGFDMLTPTPLGDVTAWLDSHSGTLPGEEVDVAGAAGRVLAAPVDAARDLPAADVAAVDGFALRAEATVGASEYSPLELRVNAAAVPVTSGQPLPEGADTVMPLPVAVLRGERLEVNAPLPCGENVVPAGREARGGDRVMEVGRVLRPVDVALLIELDVLKVPVVRRPEVIIIAARTGSRDADRPMIRALVSRDGGTGMYGEDLDARAPAGALQQRDADLVLVTGGSGLGPNDRSAAALSEAGEVVFRGVAINPGETATVGRVGGTPVVILPGPPLGSFFAYDALAGRVVRRLAGRPAGWPYATCRAALGRKIASGLGRLECCRVRLAGDGVAVPLAVSDGRTLSTAVRAEGFVLVPADSEGFGEGTEVKVYLYDQPFRTIAEEQMVNAHG